MEIELGNIIPILENMKIKVNSSASEVEEGEYLAVFNIPEEVVDKYGEDIITDSVLYITAKEVGDYKLFSAWVLFKERNRVSVTPEIYAEISSYPHTISMRRNPEGWELEKCKGLLYAEQFKERIVVIAPPSDMNLREKLRVMLEGVRVAKNKRYGGLIKKINAKKIRPWVYSVRVFEIPKIARIVRKSGGRIIY